MDNCKKKRVYMFYDDCGGTVIEYALIASLVSIAAVVVLTMIGIDLGDTYSTIAESLPG